MTDLPGLGFFSQLKVIVPTNAIYNNSCLLIENRVQKSFFVIANRKKEEKWKRLCLLYPFPCIYNDKLVLTCVTYYFEA